MTPEEIKTDLDSLTLGPNSCHAFGAPWRPSVDDPGCIYDADGRIIGRKDMSDSEFLAPLLGEEA